MLIGRNVQDLPPHLVYEAARLFLAIIDGDLHAVTAKGEETLFAFASPPDIADAMAAFGADREDIEDDGTAEMDARNLPRSLDALLAPAPRQGCVVSTWSPPPSGPRTSASAGTDDHAAPSDVAGLWPGLVRK